MNYLKIQTEWVNKAYKDNGTNYFYGVVEDPEYGTLYGLAFEASFIYWIPSAYIIIKTELFKYKHLINFLHPGILIHTGFEYPNFFIDNKYGVFKDIFAPASNEQLKVNLNALKRAVPVKEILKNHKDYDIGFNKNALYISHSEDGLPVAMLLGVKENK